MSRRVTPLLLMLTLATTLLGQRPSDNPSASDPNNSERPSVQRLDRDLLRAQSLLCTHVPTAVDLCDRIRSEAVRLGHDEYAALATAVASRGIVKLEGAEAARLMMDRAVELLPADAPAVLRGRLALLESGLHYIVSQHGASAVRLRDAFALARESGSDILLARCLVDLHDLLHVAAVGQDPSDDLNHAEALFKSENDERGVLRVLLRRAEILLNQGREDEALATLDSVASAARDLEDRGIESNALGSLFRYAMRRSDWPSAIAIGEQQVEIARKLEDLELLAASLDSVAWIHLINSDPEAATGYLNEALVLAERLELRGLLINVLQSCQEMALSMRDRDALMNYSLRLQGLLQDKSTGPGSADQAIANEILAELRTSRRAHHQATRQRDAELERIRSESEARTDLYRSAIVVTILILTSVIALVFFAGKRRAERMNALLRERTKEAEENEKARQKLEHHVRQLERLDSLGVLSAGIAHDFNNIICGIVGHAELLKDSQPLSNRQEIESILLAADRAGALCNSLLDYSKPRLQGPEVIDLREVVAGT
ncbi:MAG: histidine kinase dimerization/phospho-acceptor domain-containing protein, partial [Planctomycetota bacterium]